MRRARWPKEALFVEAPWGRFHGGPKSVYEIVEIDPLAIRYERGGILPARRIASNLSLYPGESLRPLTPAARDMLALVKRG